MADIQKNWETIYWKLRFLQFERRIHDNSPDPLVLPKTFVDHVTEIMPGKDVILKTPSGSEWKIGLKIGKDGNMFLKYGWKEFFENHFLKKKDSLVFKYIGDCKFDVTMFDGDSGIEKACSHFVIKKSSDPVTEIHQNHDKSCSVRKHRPESNDHAADSDTDDDDDDSEIHLGSDKNTATTRKRDRDDISDQINEFCQKKHVTPKGYLTKDMVRKSLYHGGCENRQAIQRTASTCKKKNMATDDDILEIRMYPTYVEPAYNLSFSKKWAVEHNIETSQEVLLVNEDGKTNKVKLYIRQNVAGMNLSGWKAFAVRNRLKVGDCCFFSVDPGPRDPIVLNVRIVRALDDVEKDHCRGSLVRILDC